MEIETMEILPLKTIMFTYSLEKLWVPSCILNMKIKLVGPAVIIGFANMYI